MRKLFQLGGLAAGAILIAFGVAAIVMSLNGTSTVNNSLKQEQIVGTPDMTPAGIKVEAQKAGLTNVSYPTCSVANTPVTSGSTARCFAEYMQIHALEATGGFVYAQMGSYVAKPGTPKAQLAPDGATSNKLYAQIDPQTKQPVANAARSVWITETALTGALNSSYMASKLALFGLVVGIALLLSGLGFMILAIGGALRAPESHTHVVADTTKTVAPTTPVATA